MDYPLDWDPDYESYYEQVMYDEGLLAPYEEEYSKRPVPDERVGGYGGFNHHPECTFDNINLDTCHCKQPYERDYQEERDAELEEMHQEWWQ